MQDLHQCSSDSEPCLWEDKWGRTKTRQHSSYVLNVMVFLFQEHLAFGKGEGDCGAPACDNIKTPHQITQDRSPWESEGGVILILPPPCSWRKSFSWEHELTKPWKVWGGRKGFLHSSLAREILLWGAALALSALLPGRWANGMAMGHGRGQAAKRRLYWESETEGTAAACWSGEKEEDMGPGGALFIVVNLHNPFIKTKQFLLLLSKLPPCQHSAPALLPAVSTCRSGGGTDGGVEEVVMSNEYTEYIEIYIFFISEKVPLRGRQP